MIHRLKIKIFNFFFFAEQILIKVFMGFSGETTGSVYRKNSIPVTTLGFLRNEVPLQN